MPSSPGSSYPSLIGHGSTLGRSSPKQRRDGLSTRKPSISDLYRNRSSFGTGGTQVFSNLKAAVLLTDSPTPSTRTHSTGSPTTHNSLSPSTPTSHDDIDAMSNVSPSDTVSNYSPMTNVTNYNTIPVSDTFIEKTSST